MGSVSVRFLAIQSIATANHRLNRVNFKETQIKDLFGANVFNEAVQRQMLPKPVFKALQKTIKQGELLDPTIADAVATAMKDWAIEKGATHFTHLFQPMTGLTAEKHDSFLQPTSDGKAIPEFSGKELVRGEPDASSFPSGGIRATFEARGYTAWDPTSPAFIFEGPNGATLVIPTAFLELDRRGARQEDAAAALDGGAVEPGLRILRLFGNTDARKVFTTVGPEQEYFLIDKNFYYARPDLLNAGRTLFGASRPRGRSWKTSISASIPERVLACMADAEAELFKLGVPVKTRHNEVAPSQYEIAPIFEDSNLATDHQMLTMEVLRRTADKYGLVCLLHEKPFAGINGSGKHNNWSMSTDTGREPAQPRRHAARQRPVPGLLRGGHPRGGQVSRAAARHCQRGRQRPSAGRQRGAAGDHLDLPGRPAPGRDRPAREGPPQEHQAGRVHGDRRQRAAEAAPGCRRPQPHQPVRVHRQQVRVPGRGRIAVDRRAQHGAEHHRGRVAGLHRHQPGSGQGGGQGPEQGDPGIAAGIIKESKKVLFNGDNYTEEWHKEAEKRGLPNLRNTVDALPVIMRKDSIELFTKYKVYSERELKSRYNILCENYVKTVSIEAQLMLMMAKTMILPAALRYQGEVATTVTATKAAGVDNHAQLELLKG